MAPMKAYRHRLTGKTGIYPDTPYWRNHPHFELVSGGGDCEDCPPVVLRNESLIVVPDEDEALYFDEEDEAEDE